MPLLVRDAAVDSLQQFLSNTLEMRTEAQLATLRANGSYMTLQAPETWKDWGNALTTLLDPANGMSLLEREYATLKQDAKQSADTYVSRVIKTRSRLTAEARRLAPAGKSSFEHTRSFFITASFDNGILHHLRLAFILEDAAVYFQQSQARSTKRETNYLLGTNLPTLILFTLQSLLF